MPLWLVQALEREVGPTRDQVAELDEDEAGFSGVEKERLGKVHFCGEHTSQDFQGHLNGGVETGERVASEILADYKAGILR